MTRKKRVREGKGKREGNLVFRGREEKGREERREEEERKEGKEEKRKGGDDYFLS